MYSLGCIVFLFVAGAAIVISLGHSIMEMIKVLLVEFGFLLVIAKFLDKDLSLFNAVFI